eukprot:CAMPEP_0167760826 /NCGR_PEP_ID=MMETSP0110_2-20121227/11807_1 /TAXON_ID=629695 /ORGANISM="Gymnochlora sp., Strain CCMP2014" /LENGTH=219 /DNA_ID=CAMNT_0007647391 /DNA_START=46 /DNA_END=705 /DNA_ORIENTATION=-
MASSLHVSAESKLIRLISKGGSLAEVSSLLPSVKNLDAKTSDGYTALIWATRRDRLNVVRMLVQRGATVDLPDNEGNTALIWASGYDQLELVKYFIEVAKANRDHQNQDGDTPLICAAYSNRPRVTSYLVSDALVDIEVLGENEMTALQWAKKEGHQLVVKIMESHIEKEKKRREVVMSMLIRDVPAWLRMLHRPLLESMYGNNVARDLHRKKIKDSVY